MLVNWVRAIFILLFTYFSDIPSSVSNLSRNTYDVVCSICCQSVEKNSLGEFGSFLKYIVTWLIWILPEIHCIGLIDINFLSIAVPYLLLKFYLLTLRLNFHLVLIIPCHQRI